MNCIQVNDERIAEQAKALPFFNNLKEEVDYVCENLIKIVRNIK